MNGKGQREKKKSFRSAGKETFPLEPTIPNANKACSFRWPKTAAPSGRARSAPANRPGNYWLKKYFSQVFPRFRFTVCSRNLVFFFITLPALLPPKRLLSSVPSSSSSFSIGTNSLVPPAGSIIATVDDTWNHTSKSPDSAVSCLDALLRRRFHYPLHNIIHPRSSRACFSGKKLQWHCAHGPWALPGAPWPYCRSYLAYCNGPSPLFLLFARGFVFCWIPVNMQKNTRGYTGRLSVLSGLCTAIPPPFPTPGHVSGSAILLRLPAKGWQLASSRAGSASLELKVAARWQSAEHVCFAVAGPKMTCGWCDAKCSKTGRRIKPATTVW